MSTWDPIHLLTSFVQACRAFFFQENPTQRLFMWPRWCSLEIYIFLSSTNRFNIKRTILWCVVEAHTRVDHLYMIFVHHIRRMGVCSRFICFQGMTYMFHIFTYFSEQLICMHPTITYTFHAKVLYCGLHSFCAKKVIHVQTNINHTHTLI